MVTCRRDRVEAQHSAEHSRELFPGFYLLWDSLSDVNLSPETSDTEVSWVGLYRSATLTTENLANCPHQLVLSYSLHICLFLDFCDWKVQSRAVL